MKHFRDVFIARSLFFLLLEVLCKFAVAEPNAPKIGLKAGQLSPLLAGSEISSAMQGTKTNSVLRAQPWRRSQSNIIRRHLLRPKISPSLGKLPDWTFIQKLPNESPVSSVASGGDFDGDGFSDVLIAEPAYSNGRGRVLFFFGGLHGLSSTPDLIMEGRDLQSTFGFGIQMLGDVNGDGLDDFFICEKDVFQKNSSTFRADIYSATRKENFQLRSGLSQHGRSLQAT
jgi:hypothetical protein